LLRKLEIGDQRVSTISSGGGGDKSKCQHTKTTKMRLLWEATACGLGCGEIGWRREQNRFSNARRQTPGKHVTSPMLPVACAFRSLLVLGDLHSRNNFASRWSSFHLNYSERIAKIIFTDQML
jgi:hypothetical protein